MRIEVMHGHTKSLDANDKLIQTRSHVRNTIARRKRQVVMRKVKSTIEAVGTEPTFLNVATTYVETFGSFGLPGSFLPDITTYWCN